MHFRDPDKEAEIEHIKKIRKISYEDFWENRECVEVKLTLNEIDYLLQLLGEKKIRCEMINIKKMSYQYYGSKQSLEQVHDFFKALKK